MAKAKVKKKTSTAKTGPIGPNIQGANLGTIGGFLGSNTLPPAAKLAAANRIQATPVPSADSMSQQLDVMEVQQEQVNAARENAAAVAAPVIAAPAVAVPVDDPNSFENQSRRNSKALKKTVKRKGK